MADFVLTQNPIDAKVDRSELQTGGIRAAQLRLNERAVRELRYSPDFTGRMTITIFWKKGIPTSMEDLVDQHQALLPSNRPTI